MRISKSDGSQTLDLQKDALVRVGLDEERIYQDVASGKKESRPGLHSCLKALQPSNTLVVWKVINKLYIKICKNRKQYY